MSEVEIIDAGPFAGLKRGHYRRIEADVPWRFATWSHRGEGRGASQHYDVMGLDDIKALPVADLAAPDSVLLLWTTRVFLEQAFEVIRAWGFSYRTTGLTWVKTQKRLTTSDLFGLRPEHVFKGLGYWSRGNPEWALLATRGKPARRAGATNVDELLFAPRRAHSQKPDEAAARFAALVAGPCVELFARRRRTDADTWGNQLDRFDAFRPPIYCAPAETTREEADRLRIERLFGAGGAGKSGEDAA